MSTYKLICKVPLWILHFFRSRESTNLAKEDCCGKIKLIHARTGGMRVLLHRGDTVQWGRGKGFERLDEGHCGRAPYPSHVTVLIEGKLSK
jgi:hypothetical protein